MQVKKQQLETDQFKIGKGLCQAVYCHCLFNSHTSCEKPGWMNHRLESRLPGEISPAWYAGETTLMAESEEELKNLLIKVKKGEWKSSVKTQLSENSDHGMWSHHFMAYRWGNNGNSDKLFSWAPKSLWMVTAAMQLKDDCLGRKAVTNLDSVYRDSRDVCSRVI